MAEGEGGVGGYEQCDQIDRLFVRKLAICKNNNLPNAQTFAE